MSDRKWIIKFSDDMDYDMTKYTDYMSLRKSKVFELFSAMIDERSFFFLQTFVHSLN